MNFMLTNDVEPMALDSEYARWTFLTNHSHVLICVSRDPLLRTRDIAEKVGITERSVQRILTELAEAGVIMRERDGRRNRYIVNGSPFLRHPLESNRRVSDLLGFVGNGE